MRYQSYQTQRLIPVILLGRDHAVSSVPRTARDPFDAVWLLSSGVIPAKRRAWCPGTPHGRATQDPQCLQGLQRCLDVLGPLGAGAAPPARGDAPPHLTTQIVAKRTAFNHPNRSQKTPFQRDVQWLCGLQRGAGRRRWAVWHRMIGIKQHLLHHAQRLIPVMLLGTSPQAPSEP
jgi:hypothetical protein